MNKIDKLSGLIGQKDAKTRLNRLIDNYNYGQKNGDSFFFPVIKFEGMSGLGKTYFAEAFAETLGFPFVEAPISAGWTWAKKLCYEITSEDEKTKITSPLPGVVFIDEAHSQKTLRDLFKKLIERETAVVERNGYKWHIDMSQQTWIFASNEHMDKALERRCEYRIELTPYSKQEKIELLKLYLKKEADKETLAYLESRAKCTAADCQTLAKNVVIATMQGGVTLEKVRSVIGEMGRFEQGIDRPEIRMLERLSKGEAKIELLKQVAGYTGETGVKQAKDGLGYLGYLGLVNPITASSFVIADDGKKYLKHLASQIEKMKAEKASAK